MAGGVSRKIQLTRELTIFATLKDLVSHVKECLFFFVKKDLEFSS